MRTAMIRTLKCLSAAVCGTGFAVLQPLPIDAAQLSITVESVRNADGVVTIDLCSEDSFLGDGCPYSATVEATEGETIIVIEDVSAGTYGVQGFHDENENTEMDRNLVGWPLEGFAFANDPEVLFRPPKFGSSSIAIGEEDLEIRRRMRYR